MANLPYMVSASVTTKILEKIKEATTPSKFTQNYLSTTLGFSGANDKAFISYAKSLGFIDNSSVPTERYKQFRNPSLSGKVLAKGLVDAYKPLFERNERFFDLSKEKFNELVCEETGFDHDNITAKRITNTFFEVKRLADFSSVFDEETIEPEKDEAPAIQLQNNNSQIQPVSKLGLSYNINLILPETDDPKVFNAIFKSLKENLLLW